MLTVKMSTSFNFAASSSNRFVCASQTGVSRDGTTLKMRTFFPVVPERDRLQRAVHRLKVRRRIPGLDSGPTSVKGLPFKVVAAERSGVLIGLSVAATTRRQLYIAAARLRVIVPGGITALITM